MRINVNQNENVNGTLILPFWQGSGTLSDEESTGIHRALKKQIDTVIEDQDFKGKLGSTMTLRGTEGGKAILVGLGKRMKVPLKK